MDESKSEEAWECLATSVEVEEADSDAEGVSGVGWRLKQSCEMQGVHINILRIP